MRLMKPELVKQFAGSVMFKGGGKGSIRLPPTQMLVDGGNNDLLAPASANSSFHEFDS